MTTIPDHVGREAVRLLNEITTARWNWPKDKSNPTVITVAKLLMNPPAPMTDPDEEAAKRVLTAAGRKYNHLHIIAATKQIRKEREAWEAGR